MHRLKSSKQESQNILHEENLFIMTHISRKNCSEKRQGAVEQNEILRHITELLSEIHSRGEAHGKHPSSHAEILDHLSGKLDISNESLNEWRPAEEAQPDSKPTKEGDIFSLGCYFYYVVTGGQHPFGKSGERALFIAHNLYHLAGCRDPHLQKLIARMINHDCTKRPKSSELLDHPYLWNNKTTEEYLLKAAEYVTDEKCDRFEKWKGTILLSEKLVGLNGARKKLTKVTNVAAVLRQIKENKENPTDLCEMFPNLLFAVYSSENPGREIDEEIDESLPEKVNDLLIANGSFREVKSVTKIKRRHGRLGLQHVHVIQFLNDSDDTTNKVEHLRYLSHPNCLQCFYAVENSAKIIFMAFETFNETLETWIENKGENKLEREIIHEILRQITKGLVYYHSNKLTHGKLSLGQIVIFEKGSGPDAIVVKVASFSLRHVKYSSENPAAATNIDIRDLGKIFSNLLSESQQVSQSHVHLIRAMKELALPSAASVLKHPFLWSPEMTKAFLLAAGDFYEHHSDFDKTSKPDCSMSASLKTNREALLAFSSQIRSLDAVEHTLFVAEWTKQFPKLILQTWLRLQKFKRASSDVDVDLSSFYHPNYDFPTYDELISDEKSITTLADDTPPPQNFESGKSEIQTITNYLDHEIQRILDMKKEVSKKVAKWDQVTSSIMEQIDKMVIKPSPLHVACQSDEFYDFANTLMESGIDPNKKNINGFAPLHVAADRKAPKIVLLLIKKKAELEIRDDKYQITPIFFAVNNNSVQIVALFVENKAKVNSSDPFGRTPLHLAVTNNSWDAAKILLEGGAHVNSQDAFGISSLHIAVDINSVNMVKLLLDYKGDPNASILPGAADDRIGCLLHLAVVRNSPEMVEVLLNAGADPNQRNNFGETALHLAALQKILSPNRLNIVNLLIGKGANPYVIDNSGHTVLYAAIFNKAEEIVNRLLELNCPIGVNQREIKMGLTPLHLAAVSNLENIVTALIAKGATIHAEDKNGLTPLEYAAAFNAANVAKRLLELDATAITRYESKNVRSPLHVAAAYDALQVGELLISKGADINCVDKLFLTPLHYAAYRKSARFIEFLKTKKKNSSTATTSSEQFKHQKLNSKKPSKDLSKKSTRKRLKQKNTKAYLSKKLSPEELALIPQLVDCFESIRTFLGIPNNIQINCPTFVTQFPNIRLTLTQEIVTNVSYGN